MDRAWEAEGVCNQDKAILLVVYLYVGQLFLMVVMTVQDLGNKSAIGAFWISVRLLDKANQSHSFSLIIKMVLAIILLATSFSQAAVTYECYSEAN